MADRVLPSRWKVAIDLIGIGRSGPAIQAAKAYASGRLIDSEASHESDCAKHDESAYGIGPCTCGAAVERCRATSFLCSENGGWAVIAPDGKTFVSCDDHLSQLVYGDGHNRVFGIEKHV